MLGCGYDSALSNRCRNALCDIIWHALLINNKAARREQTCSSNCKARPGDIFHPDFVDGRPAFFDVTARNTVQAKYVCEAAEMAGAAARAGELERITNTSNRYWNVEDCSTLWRWNLLSFGFWTQASLQTLRTIAAKTTTYNGIDLLILL